MNSPSCTKMIYLLINQKSMKKIMSHLMKISLKEKCRSRKIRRKITKRAKKINRGKLYNKRENKRI